MTRNEQMNTERHARRVRTSRGTKRAERNWFFNQVRDGRMDMWMLAVATIFSLVSALQFYGRLGYYSDVAMYWTPAETVYGHGQPDTKRSTPDGEIWTYGKQDNRIDIRFDKGRVAESQCSKIGDRGRCEEIFGVLTGSHEGTIWQQWGEPTRVRFDGDYKYLTYDDVGLKIVLYRYQVISIALEKRSPANVSYITRFIRMAYP